MLPQAGKILILAGGVAMVVGVILLFSGKIPLVGKLPGYIIVKRENFSLYLPIATSIVVSIALTLLLNVFGHFFRR